MIPKRYIILGSIITLVVIVGISVIFFFKEYRKVTFIISYPNVSAELSSQSASNKSFAAIQNNTTLWLKNGTYFARFNDKKLSNAPLEVVIDNKTTTVTLDPNLSSNTLVQLLKSEQAIIDQKVRATIASNQNYTLGETFLYHQGEWCSSTIKVYQAASSDPDIANPDNADTYYLVLKKEKSDWKVVAGPSLIITKPDNPSIPPYVINAINPIRSS